MLGYALRRLLIVPPTLLLVLLVLFAVVNAVPALPPSDSPGTSERDDPRRAWQVFREQYGLDRPVFVNLNHRLTPAEVRAALDDLVGEDDTRAVVARQTLYDLGRDAVPHLAREAGDETGSAARRAAALRILPDLVIRPVRAGEPVERREARRADNRAAESLRLSKDPAPDELRAAARGWEEYVAARPEVYAPDAAEVRRRVLLDTRFARYLSRVIRLDFGESMADQEPVLPTIFRRLRYSLFLSAISIALAYLLAVPLGALCGWWRGSRFDRVASLVLFAMYSLPTYFAAALLIRLLCDARALDWFPGSGFRTLRGFDELSPLEQALDVGHHLVLPVFCLTYGSLAVLSRFARASMSEVLQQDFIRTARAKGVGEARMLFGHGLKNALLPVVTLVGSVLPAVFSGAVIVEVLFDIPGTGTLLYESILGRDYNAVLAITLIASVLTLLGYLLSDLLYAVVDPRIRLGARGRA